LCALATKFVRAGDKICARWRQNLCALATKFVRAVCGVGGPGE
jgi:hypothetical protein